MNLKKNKDILELELRNKIYILVSKYAGSHLRELERKSNIPYSTIKYHLNYLTKHDLIIEKNTKFYPKSIKTEDTDILSFLRQKNNRKILLFILTNNKATHKDLEYFTNLSPSTVTWYTQTLIKKNMITKINNNNEITYKLIYNKDNLVKILVTYKESFLDSLVDKAIDMWDIRN